MQQDTVSFLLWRNGHCQDWNIVNQNQLFFPISFSFDVCVSWPLQTHAKARCRLKRRWKSPAYVDRRDASLKRVGVHWSFRTLIADTVPQDGDRRRAVGFGLQKHHGHLSRVHVVLFADSADFFSVFNRRKRTHVATVSRSARWGNVWRVLDAYVTIYTQGESHKTPVCQ